MITYRSGDANDLQIIARLHAQSWSDHYRGSNFSDAFLDGPVFEERLNVWALRFQKANPNQHIILAFSENQLIGFVCFFINKHPSFGSLIDNLHVATSHIGQGIGKELMSKAAVQIGHLAHTPNYYLYVLDKNKSAIHFYEKVGGIIDGKELYKNPGGGSSTVYRVIWKDANL